MTFFQWEYLADNLESGPRGSYRCLKTLSFADVRCLCCGGHETTHRLSSIICHVSSCKELHLASGRGQELRAGATKEINGLILKGHGIGKCRCNPNASEPFGEGTFEPDDTEFMQEDAVLPQGRGADILTCGDVEANPGPPVRDTSATSLSRNRPSRGGPRCPTAPQHLQPPYHPGRPFACPFPNFQYQAVSTKRPLINHLNSVHLQANQFPPST